MADYDFMVKSKLFSLSFDKKFNIFDANDKLIGLCNQKAFKLKEDIRVFSDESMTKEIIKIQAKQIVDFSAAYDIYDSDTNTLFISFRLAPIAFRIPISLVLSNTLTYVSIATMIDITIELVDTSANNTIAQRTSTSEKALFSFLAFFLKNLNKFFNYLTSF